MKAKLRQQPCGTRSGYLRHRRNGEQACVGCMAANRQYQRDRRSANPDQRDLERQMVRARQRAAWRLVDEHRDRFRDLVVEELAVEKGEVLE